MGFSDFLNQQEKFAISATCVTKLTLAAKAAFIHKILCVEVFKILSFQSNGWQDARKFKAFMNTKPLPWQESAPLVHIVLPVKNGPLPAELKFRGNFEYAMCYFI